MDGATKKAGQKHATLYLPGGDIVLCSAFNDSESDPPRTLFCVSKATLAFHSPVFAGMFTLPDKPDTQDTYEGLPLVRIPDAEEELEGLLFALYSPASVTSLTFERWEHDTPLKLRGVMKLAAKYEIDSVQERIQSIMRDTWPVTFAGWLRSLGEIKVVEDLVKHDSQKYVYRKFVSGKRLDECVPEPASAIRLAHDYNIPDILPAAYYMLATISVENDWDEASSNKPKDRLRRSARWALLDGADMRRVSRVRERLVETFDALLATYTSEEYLRNQTASCEREVGDKNECFEYVDELADIWSEELVPSDGKYTYNRFDPLRLLDTIQGKVGRSDLCTSCAERLRDDILVEQKAIWDILPPLVVPNARD